MYVVGSVTVTRTQYLLRRVLDAATPGVAQVAGQLGVSASALRRYRDGSRGVPLALFIRLARVLRERAARLTRLADELERHARGEP